MTTSSDYKLSPELSEQRTRWARKILGVSPNATEEETTRAIFTRLEAENFVPSEGCRAAALTLTNPGSVLPSSPNDDDSFMRHLEQELCCEVDAFAEEFFEFPPAERKRRWEDISAKCGDFIVPKTRILALRPGLSVELAKCRLRNQYESDLAGFICKSFTVLDPSKRFVLQIEFQRRKNWKPKKIRIAAKRLLTKYPKVAALTPDLINDIRAIKAPQPKLATTTGDSKGTPTWAVLVGIIIAGSVVSAIVRHAPENHNRYGYSEKEHSANYAKYRENLRKHSNQPHRPASQNGITTQTESYPFPPSQKTNINTPSPYNSTPSRHNRSRPAPPKMQSYRHPDKDDSGFWLPPVDTRKPTTQPTKSRTSLPSSKEPPILIQLPGLVPDSPEQRSNASSEGLP